MSQSCFVTLKNLPSRFRSSRLLRYKSFADSLSPFMSESSSSPRIALNMPRILSHFASTDLTARSKRRQHLCFVFIKKEVVCLGYTQPLQMLHRAFLFACDLLRAGSLSALLPYGHIDEICIDTRRYSLQRDSELEVRHEACSLPVE